MEYTNITTLIRGIPKFDGTASKFQDWKRSARAMLQLARPGIFGMLNGPKRPQEIDAQVLHRSTINTPVHSVVDAAGDDADNVGEQQDLAQELQEEVPVQLLTLQQRCIALEIYRLTWRPHIMQLLQQNSSIKTPKSKIQQHLDLHSTRRRSASGIKPMLHCSAFCF